MKWNEIKDKTVAELKFDLDSLRSQFLEKRFRVATGASRQVHEIGKLRLAIVRVITRLAQLAEKK